MISKSNRMFGAVLLVAGTTIGAGMLALPITTGLAGFLPALLLMSVVWLLMLLTALYLLEVNLRLREESNLISMMRTTLGRPGEVVSWIVYLLLLYSLIAAYLVGCSQILAEIAQTAFSIGLSDKLLPLLAVLPFGLCVYLGTGAADALNRIFMIGLIGAYVSLLTLGCCHIHPPLLTHVNWKFLLPSVSIVSTSFGYHIIIPTISTYLEHDGKRLRQAIVLGSLIPFLVYLLWQFLVMGIVPIHGANGLLEAAQRELQGIFVLQLLLTNPWVGVALHVFAFFAMVTSLLGVALSLSDFLADGLNIKKTRAGKSTLILLTFIPPLLFALFYPRGFVMALNYAGMCAIILLALLPSLMAWGERYGPRAKRTLLPSHFRVFGGKPLLLAAILFSLVLLGVEVFG